MEVNGEDPKTIGKTFFEVYWSKAQVNELNFFLSLLSTSNYCKFYALGFSNARLI